MKNLIGKLFILIIAIFTLCVGCGVKNDPESKPIIKIGYLPITHATPLFVDVYKHGNDFGDYEVELVKFGSWPDLMDALNAGRIDGASVLIQLAMKAKEKGIDLKAIALGHLDGNVIISSEEIETASDIKGTTFAIPHTYSTHHLLLHELILQEGLQYDDVDMVEMPPAEMPAALAEDRIAGYVVAEPFGAFGVHLNVGKVLAFSDEVWPHSYCCVLVFRNEFLETYPEVADQFMENYVTAGKEANEKNEQLYEALQLFMNVEDEVLDLSLEWISFEPLRIEKAEYEKVREKVQQLKLMEHPPTYEEFVETSLIDRASEDDRIK